MLAYKNAKEVFCMGGELEDSIKVQEEIKDSVLIDDAITAPDETTKRINGHPLSLHYSDQLFGKKFSDLTFIYRSKNGTRVLDLFGDKKYVFVGGLVNLSAIKKVLDSMNIDSVTLIPCGSSNGPNADDSISAEYMKIFLEKGEHDYAKYKDLMSKITSARGSGDFFEKYILSQYGTILGFNICLDLYPVVFQANRDTKYKNLNLVSLKKHA